MSKLWRESRTETFTVITPYKTASHNRYQPHPAKPEQHTKCSNRAFDLLKMDIMMPETCWDRSNNKHLIVASCWFFSLHTLRVRHLFYLPLISNLTPTFSSQQSEVTTAVVFSYKTVTRHLPPLGPTASVELLSLTDLTFSSDFLTPTLKKMIQISLLAVSYFGTILKRNKSQVSRRPSCLRLQKVPYKMSVGHASFTPENPECYLGPCC